MAAQSDLDRLAAQPLQILYGQIPIVMKYNQEDVAKAIRDWCKTDEFLKFAIDNLCAYSEELGVGGAHRFVRGLKPGDPFQFPAGLTWPFTKDQFVPLTPEKIAFLNEQLFKIADVQVWPAHDGVKMSDLPPEAVPNGYVWQRVVPEDDGYLSSWTYCTMVPPKVFELLLISALRTNKFLPHERRIIGIDLYLNRHFSTNLGQHGWHSDKLALLGDPAPRKPPEHVAECVSYLSLLMLMEDGAKGKSTTFTSTEKATTNPLAPTTADGTPYKNTLTLPVQMGSCVVANDSVCFHSSPHTPLVKDPVDASSGLTAYDGEPVMIVQTPANLVGRLTPEEEVKLETPTTRSFVRVHFIDYASKYYDYTAFSEPDAKIEHFIGFEALTVPAIAEADTLRLDQTKAATTAFEAEMAQFFLKSRSIGGTKRVKKRNKTLKRGGGNEQFIISFDIKDFYFFRKERTGLFINLT
jgi:hypothetical protein